MLVRPRGWNAPPFYRRSHRLDRPEAHAIVCVMCSPLRCPCWCDSTWCRPSMLDCRLRPLSRATSERLLRSLDPREQWCEARVFAKSVIRRRTPTGKDPWVMLRYRSSEDRDSRITIAKRVERRCHYASCRYPCVAGQPSQRRTRLPSAPGTRVGIGQQAKFFSGPHVWLVA
jgi:hypothetical protein